MKPFFCFFFCDGIHIELSELFSLNDDGFHIIGELKYKFPEPFDDGLENLIAILDNYAKPFLENDNQKFIHLITKKQNERIVLKNKKRWINTENEMILVLSGIALINTSL